MSFLTSSFEAAPNTARWDRKAAGTVTAKEDHA